LYILLLHVRRQCSAEVHSAPLVTLRTMLTILVRAVKS
jgi:hypothetical protein